MTTRSQKSLEKRKALSAQHRLNTMAMAYYKETELSPAEAMLVTQEVQDDKGRVVGLQQWFEPRSDGQSAAFLINLTKAISIARRAEDGDSLEKSLKLLDNFYDQSSRPESSTETVQGETSRGIDGNTQAQEQAGSDSLPSPVAEAEVHSS